MPTPGQLPSALHDRRADDAGGSEAIPRDPTRAATLKFMILIASLGLGLLIVRWSPLNDYLHSIHRIRLTLDQAGVWALLVFSVVCTLLTALGVPRLLFCGIGGAIFGFAKGWVSSHFATVAGAYLNFLYARWLGRDLVRRRLTNVEKFSRVFNDHPLWGVILIRQLPLAGLLVNSFLGLTPVTHSAFLLGSLIGFLPEGIVVTLLASSAGTATREEFHWRLALTIIILCLVTLAAWKIHQMSRLQRELERDLMDAGPVHKRR